jgi:predicted RNA-binding Zn-ribbon protein involved in translation (DUF1610 family)
MEAAMVSLCEACQRCGLQVVFESDSVDAICPECGWARSAASVYAKQKRKQQLWTWIKRMGVVMMMLSVVGVMLIQGSTNVLQQAMVKTVATAVIVGALAIVVVPLFMFAHWVSTGKPPSLRKWLLRMLGKE